jgi:hypothetical protein
MHYETKRKLGSFLTSLLLMVGQLVPFFSFFAPNYTFADVNPITPSTNDINRTNGWAHVDQLTQSVGSTDLEFISTRTFWSCFEYRTDGDTSQIIPENGGVNYNSGVADGLYPYYCQNNNSSTHTINANEYVEVRMVFGAETDERFDWTRFNVLPPDTTSPTVPVIFDPANGSFLTTANLLKIDWYNSTDPGDSNPVEYQYQSFHDSAYTSSAYLSGWFLASEIPTPGTPEGTYYLRVRARDAVGNESDWSNGAGDPYLVTVDNTAPAAPAIVFPDEGDYFTTQPILNDWTDVVDDLSGLDYYRIEYSYDDGHTFSGFPYRTTQSAPNPTLSQRNHVPAIGEQGGVEFRVQAFDNAGNEGPWSEWRHYYYDASDPWTIFTDPSDNQIFAGSIYIAGVSEDDPDFGGIVDQVDLFYRNADEEDDWQLIETFTNSADDEPFAWSIDWTPPSDGTYDLKAAATDRAGNVEGTAYVYGITYDVTAPSVKITSPSDNGYFFGTVDVRGTVLDDNLSHYWLYIWGSAAVINTVVYTGELTDSSLFTWNTNAYPEGVYTIELEARDLAGNKDPNLAPVLADPEVDGDSVDWINVTVDRTAPMSPTPLSPVDGFAIKGIDFTQTWTSIADAVQYRYQSCYTDPGDFGGACSSVKWTSTHSSASKFVAASQPNSHFWWRVQAKDAAGNWSEYGSAFELIIDNSKPVTTLDPLISNPTNDSTPTFTGHSDDVYLAGVSLVEYKVVNSDTSAVVVDWTTDGVSATDGGFDSVSEDFSITLATIADGNYTIYVRATDRAGNVESTASESFTIDTVAPSKPTGIGIYEGHNSSGDFLGCGGYTNNPGGDPNPKITIDWDQNPEPDIDYYWFGTRFNPHHKKVDYPTSLYNGSMTPGYDYYYYTVSAVDNAGNESEISDSCYLYLDEEEPSSTIISPTDGQVFGSAITIEGSSEDDPDWGLVDTVNLYFSVAGEGDWQLIETFTNSADDEPFAWSTDWTPPLDDTYDLKAAATDRAGNEESTAYVYGIIYDTTAPVSYFTSPEEGAIFGGPDETPISIEGYSTDEPSETVESTTLYYSPADEENWDELETFENTEEDDPFYWSYVWTPEEDGEYDFKAVATDKAGNTEESAYLSGIIYDTTDPVVNWNSPTNGNALSGNSVVLDTSASDIWLTGSTAYYYKTTGADDSTLTLITSPWDLGSISLGYYTLVAQAVDLAGNLGEARIDIEIKAVVSDEAAGETTTTSFTVTWTTDKPTTSRVVYDTVSHPVLGGDPNYDYAFSTATFDDPAKVTSHSVTVTGLTPGTLYYFRTVSSGSPTTVGEELSAHTGDVLAAETESDGEVLGAEVLPDTGIPMINLLFAALAFEVGLYLRRRSRLG